VTAIQDALPNVSMVWPPAGDAKAVVVNGAIRIKAGAEPFTDSGGSAWQPELGFEGGRVASLRGYTPIANTKDPGLYQSEHHSMASFSCDAANGNYLARLHFAETHLSGEATRVFSFTVHGHEFKDFDVWKKAGGSNTAYIETVPVEVTDGTFNITFTKKIDNPQINAIELVPESEASGRAAN
jgi:hypothetical protein